MRKNIALFLVAVAVFIIVPSDLKAQDRNSISGFIFDETRRPVAQVYVELLNDFYSTVARVRTQGTGMYSFAGLPQGRYNIKVLSGGTDYEEQTQSVSLVPLSVIQGRGIASEQVDFYLKTKRQKNAGLSAAPGVVFGQDVPDEAKTLYESGVNDLSDKKDVAAGLDKIKRSIELFPDYFLALDRLGTEYVMRGYYEPAYVLLTKAIAVNPRSFTSTFGLGLAEFRLGQTDPAIALFKKAIEMDKASANGHLWLGIALHTKNNLSAALASLLQANKLSGETSSEVHWQLARVYKDQKKYSMSADELELFLQYKPDAQNLNEIKQIISSLRLKK